MKKIALLITSLYCTCFMASPALAQGPRRTFFNDQSLKRSLTIKYAEDTTCKGPRKIYFANKTFEWESASDIEDTQNPCTAKYTTSPTVDGKADDWATYAVFYSQLIKDPQEEVVLDTVRTLVPAYVNEKLSEKYNLNDIVFAYRFTEKQLRQDFLHYVLLRAFRQSDQSIRIYRFEIVMQANARTSNGTSAYDHFNNMVSQNRSSWFKSMRTLVTQK